MLDAYCISNYRQPDSLAKLVFPTSQDDLAHGAEKGPEQTQKVRGSSRAPQDMDQAGDTSFEKRPVPRNATVTASESFES